MIQLVVWAFILIPISIFLWSIYALLKARFGPLNHIPGWTLRNPLFGSMADSGYMGLLERYKYEYENFGTIYRLHMPLGITYVVVTDPEAAKRILQTNSKNYIRPPLSGMGAFRRLVGQSSILLSNGDAHRNQRALATPAFTPSNLRQLTPAIVECGRKLVARLTSMIDSSSASSHPPLIDVKPELSRCTLDVIGRAGFGYDFDCMSGWETTPMGDGGGRKNASSSVQMVMDYVTHFKLWYYIPYSDWLPTRANRDFNTGLAQLHGVAERMIDERTEALLGKQKECKNLLDMMITGGSERALDRATLRDQLMTFLMAGHETSSLALTYVLYFLCKNLQWQDECRREIVEKLANDDELFFEKLNNDDDLKITRAVIYESLRLLPPVFALARRSIETDQLGPYSIPGGTNVAVLVTQMHRSPACWGEDVEQFKPERFMADEGGEAKVPWEAYMPFGEGNRKCVGYKFALSEILILLALLLKEFSFRLSPDELEREMDFFGIVTMLPCRPIRLYVRKL